MSGPRGFHNSSGDVARNYAGRGALGYDSKRGAMSDILGGGGNDFQEPVAPPVAPRDRGQNMASLMDYTQTNMAAGASRPAAGRRQAPAVTNPAPSAMDEIIRGVGEMGADDKLYGLSKKKLDQRYAGNGALAALRGEEAEAGMDDPFAHHRKPKLHARDMGIASPPPAGGIPGTEDAANRQAVAAIEASERKVFESLRAAHQALNAAAQSAPRDGSGALSDYRPLLSLLTTEHNIKLNADAAGTLVATLDVQRGVSFEEFMEIIAMGLRHDDPPARPPAGGGHPQQPQQQQFQQQFQPQPAAPVVKGVRADPVSLQQAKQMQMPKQQPTSAYAPYMPNYPQPKAPQNVSQLLGGAKVSSSAVAGASGLAGNTELAALLNGSTNHSRRSEMPHTVGKSSQWR